MHPRIAPDALAPVVEHAMPSYLLGHVKDHVLESELASLVGRERGNTALILAHIAEVSARKLYLSHAYPSMYAYCVVKLKLAEDSACRRIQAAQAARRHPMILEMVADGRLSLSTVVLLDPHLTAKNATELLAAAAGKSKSDVQQLLADRAPKPDVPAWVQDLRQPPSAPAYVGAVAPQAARGSATEVMNLSGLSAPERMDSESPSSPAPEQAGRVARPSESAEHARLSPLGASRFALQVTISQETRDKLQRAKDLLGHKIPSGDLAQLLDAALDALIEKHERRKYAKAGRPAGVQKPGAAARRSVKGGRHVPAKVRRAVNERDQGQCTFVSETGQRCEERKRLEFDHIKELARGGEATVENIRLRCRAHNQYTAEKTYGARFMQKKRGRQSAREGAERHGSNGLRAG